MNIRRHKFKTMMKKKIQIWVLAATIACGAATGVVACDKANAQVDNPAAAKTTKSSAPTRQTSPPEPVSTMAASTGTTGTNSPTQTRRGSC